MKIDLTEKEIIDAWNSLTEYLAENGDMMGYPEREIFILGKLVNECIKERKHGKTAQRGA